MNVSLTFSQALFNFNKLLQIAGENIVWEQKKVKDMK